MIAVDHPALVGVQEGVGERNADLHDLLVAERLRGEQRGEGLAVDELGDQVEGVVLDAGLVQRDDRGVAEARGGQRLTVARSRSSPSPPAGRGIALTATSRSSSPSWARHTTPKPPAPRRSSRW